MGLPLSAKAHKHNMQAFSGLPTSKHDVRATVIARAFPHHQILADIMRGDADHESAARLETN